MSKRLTPQWPVTALTRVLDALEQDLLEAADEEILEAARTLGMNPEMRGSAAYLGLKSPEKPKVSDFFNLEAWNVDAAHRLSPVTLVDRKASPTPENEFRLRTARKDSLDK